MDQINVLVVDDEERFLITTAKLLRKNNFNVMTASGASEAIDLLKQHPVAVVVLDVKMPGLDGLNALEIIRRDHPFVQVIMLTGHATFEAAVEGLKLGAYKYLMKPVDISELMSNIINAYQELWRVNMDKPEN